MALVIKQKLPCNTVGFSSNKENKPYLMMDVRRIAERYDDLGIAVLKPDIDHMAFGLPVTDAFLKYAGSTEDLMEYRQHIAALLFGDAKVNANGMSMVEGVPFMKKPWANYNINVRFKPSKAEDQILIQAVPKNPASNLDFLRFVMNPSRFTTDDFAEFRVFIKELLCMPGTTITYEQFLVWCKIYRADVAVDIIGCQPSDLEIIPLIDGKPAPKKSHVYKSGTGRPETIYPGAVKGTSSGAYIYDKRRERLDAGQEPIYGDFYHSRFECRISKTTFYKLAKIYNRCGRVSVRALDHKKFDKLHHDYKVFIRYVLQTTLNKGLMLIPEKYRLKYSQTYEAAFRDIWDAKKLWAFWKDTVKNSGFFPLLQDND